MKDKSDIEERIEGLRNGRIIFASLMLIFSLILFFILNNSMIIKVSLFFCGFFSCVLIMDILKLIIDREGERRK